MEDEDKRSDISAQSASVGNSVAVSVSKAAVYEKVEREASYIGSKAVTAEDPKAYERIHIGSSDEAMLDILWLEGWTELTRSLKDYVTAQPTEKSGTMTLTLVLPDGADMAQLDMEASIVTYIKDAILSKWLTFTASASATVYGNMAIAALNEIRMKLAGRKMKARENVGGEDDVDEQDGEVERDVETEDGTVRARPVAASRDVSEEDGTVRARPVATSKDVSEEDGTDEQEGEVERIVETGDGIARERPVSVDRKVRRSAAVSVRSGQCKRGVQQDAMDEITLSTINNNKEDEKEI